MNLKKLNDLLDSTVDDPIAKATLKKEYKRDQRLIKILLVDVALSIFALLLVTLMLVRS